MNRIDEMYAGLLRELITHGKWNTAKGEWADGTPARAKALFSVKMRFYPEHEAGLWNLRRTYPKMAINEMKWIHIDQSNSIDELRESYNIKWWDAWADSRGTTGKGYGYQAAQKHIYLVDGEEVRMTQIDYVRWALQNDPDSRRMVITLWNPKEQHEMTLPPCAHTVTFNVIDGRLYAELSQRSQDVMAAVNINAFQYMGLQRMLAAEAGLALGDFVHEVVNFHVYDRHIPLVEQMLADYEANRETLVSPVLRPLPRKALHEYTASDFLIEGYAPLENEKIEIALV